ncbi:MAG TPA: M48 family metallopeptidase [Vicinamibacterales bacterium]
MTRALSFLQYSRLLPVLLLAIGVASASAQTKIALDPNSYSLQQDVQLGREAADEARKQLPMLSDDRVDDYVERVGENLVDAIPPEFRHAGFRYTFDVVNQKEINAFALPGGPMFLNRGMLEAAKSEAEMAGVMAHEISHVILRHGTAQATKGQKFQIGAIAGQVLGAIVGGTAGSIIAQGSQFGLGAYFLKYSREYERQADLFGAQLMARAGYDPRAMASMFRTIQAEGGRSGPEWLSSHPDPGNRSAAITTEASMLRVQGNADTGQFASVQSRLRGMSPAYTAEQIARGQARSRSVGTAGRAVNVAPPSTQFRTYRAANFLRVSVPANWEQLNTGSAVTYAPDGGFFQGDAGGQTTFTHGIEIGVTEGGGGNLQRDTQQLLQNFARSNPQLQRAGNARRVNIGGRQGLATPLANVSEVTGQREYINLSTAQLRDGTLLYMIGVAPQPEAAAYERAFQRVRETLQIADR